jgi:hypothetical protein
VTHFFNAATNHFPDPGFEAGWVPVADFHEVASGCRDYTRIVESPVIEGSYSLAVAVDANTVNGARDLSRLIWEDPALELSFWSASAVCGFVDPNLTGLLRLSFHGQLGELATESVSTDVAQLQPVRLTIEGVQAPLGTETVRLTLGVQSATSGGSPEGQAVFDQVMYSELDKVPRWFSGDSGGATWLGTPHASASQRLGVAETMTEWQNWVPDWFYSEQDED